MRALICDDYGGIESLRVGDLPDPEVRPGSVLVRVASAVANFADTLMVSGTYQLKPEPPFAPGYELKYNKHYIGLAQNGQANNFVAFRPQRTAIRFEPKLPKSDETTARLEEAGLEVLEYDRHFGYYKVRLSPEDLEKHKDLLTELMQEAYEAKL